MRVLLHLRPPLACPKTFPSAQAIRFASYRPVSRVKFPKPEPSTPKKQPKNFRELLGNRHIVPFAIFCGGAFIASFYIGSVYTSYRRTASEPYKDVPADVTDRWDNEAKTFDRDVENLEYYMGLNWLRWWLIRQVHGHVLEASAGTGRNIPWYPVDECDSITMVDQSRKMIEIARERWRKEFPAPSVLAKATFRHQSVIDDVKLPDPDGFDFVVQTMGLCSTPEPEALIRNLARMTKKDGRILLLEHGRSKWDWLNQVLDNTAAPRADKHGCWWNKDIGKIVEDSGVEVVQIRRYHFGTTWWIELKPGDWAKGGSKHHIEEGKAGIQEQQLAQFQSPAKSWWRFWSS